MKSFTKDNKGRFIKGHHYSPETEFKSGHVPFNKGTIGLMKPNRTSFTRDNIKRNDYITPMHFGRDGLYMSLENEFVERLNKNGKTYNHHKRISLGSWVLKQNGIDIPKGYVAYHKDGDLYNNDISNLEVISRAELLKRNRRIK